MMIWKSLGLLFNTESKYDWMVSHASLPTILTLNESNFRVIFSTRDKHKRSYTTYVDLNMSTWKPGQKLIHNQKQASFSPGRKGHFDDCGVSISSLYKDKEELFGYYLGWTLKKSVLFSNEIGIVHIDKNFKFSRIQNMPIYGRTEIEPLTFGYPTVLKNAEKIYMYYDGIDEWDDKNIDNYKFDLRQANLDINNKWTFAKKNVIPLKPNERAITRPSLMTINEKSYMIFSSDIGGKYRLDAAEQNLDGSWSRLVEFKFIKSGQDWDNEETTYPCIFKYREEFYTLYNGNNYGETGFGIAKLEKY
jgi:hypothetical protein